MTDLDRYTERARDIVRRAREEARCNGDNEISSLHLLMAIQADEESLASCVLERLRLDWDALDHKVDEIYPPSDPHPTEVRLEFTYEGRRVLDLALREALGLGHNYVGTEHILLALTRHVDGRAAVALAQLGIDGEAVRNEVIRCLSGAPRPEAEEEGTLVPDANVSDRNLALLLAEMCLSAKAADMKLRRDESVIEVAANGPDPAGTRVTISRIGRTAPSEVLWRGPALWLMPNDEVGRRARAALVRRAGGDTTT